MIKIAVCEDDKFDTSKIKTYIEHYAQERDLEYRLYLFDSAEQFIESKINPDILFLDILMNEKDGIQLGMEVRNARRNIILIYITNLKEKMATAFNQIHSFGFLLKPVVKEQIYGILDDALVEIENSIHSHIVTYKSENNTLIELSVMDIYYFEYSNRKIKIVTKDRNYICINEKITSIAEQMEPYGFTMSHQSFVVNLYHVDKMTPNLLIMKNGDSVYLAQKRSSAVRKKLMQIVKESIANGGSKG